MRVRQAAVVYNVPPETGIQAGSRDVGVGTGWICQSARNGVSRLASRLKCRDLTLVSNMMVYVV